MSLFEIIINDSVFLSSLEQPLSLEFILDICKEFYLVERLYAGDYNFTDDEFVKLIDTLNFLDCTRTYNKLKEILIVVKMLNPIFVLENICYDMIREINFINLEFEFLYEEASFRGYLNLLKYLFENNNFQGYQIDIIFEVAFENEHNDIIMYLLGDKKFKFRDEMNDVMHNLCISGNLQLIEYLFNSVNYIEDDDVQNYFLNYAFKAGHVDVIRYLIEERDIFDDISEFGNEFFLIGCKCGHLQAIKYLFEETDYFEVFKEWFSENGNKPLIEARRSGNIDLVNYLLDNEVLREFLINV